MKSLHLTQWNCESNEHLLTNFDRNTSHLLIFSIARKKQSQTFNGIQLSKVSEWLFYDLLTTLIMKTAEETMKLW